nr:transposase, MuDR, MULE transposase domain protein [Tanacetum cinerariifolium]
MVSPTLSFFHDDPYMKVMHAYDTIIPPQVPIPPSTIVPPSLMLSPIFKNSFFPMKYCHQRNEVVNDHHPLLLPYLKHLRWDKVLIRQVGTAYGKINAKKNLDSQNVLKNNSGRLWKHVGDVIIVETLKTRRFFMYAGHGNGLNYIPRGGAARRTLDRDVTRVYRPNDIINDLNIEFNIDVSYKRAWKGKQLALKSNQGDLISSSAQLPYYFYNLKLANENIVTHIDTNHEGRFKMLFIAFGAAMRI